MRPSRADFDSSRRITPAYLTTSAGQIGIWHCGDHGPTVVGVAGLTWSARHSLDDLSRVFPECRVIVAELPGVGGSARAVAGSADAAGWLLADALSFLKGQPFALVSFDLAAASLPVIVDQLQPALVATVELEDALQWTRTATAPPALTPVGDGSHLGRLWTFLRDRRLLDPADPHQPRSVGRAPPLSELSEVFLDAVVEPDAFADRWNQSISGLAVAVERLVTAAHCREVNDLWVGWGGPPPVSAAQIPQTAPGAGSSVWHQYVETSCGRAHLRRAGSSGEPVMVLSSGGGSSAHFASVVTALGATRTAVAMDYFGNGRSEKLARVATMEAVVDEVFAVADSLGWDRFDVWGSHTGACVALEMAVQRPDRIRKGVLEAPVFVSTEFYDDLMANYFMDFAPHRFGLHLPKVWHWRRDQFMYWPWYRADAEHSRSIGVPGPRYLHLNAVGILESGTTYEGVYRVGFGYDTEARLPLLTRPALLTAGPHDMLGNALTDAAALVPEGLLQIVPTPTTIWWPDPEPAAAAATIGVYRAFLDP